MNSFLFTVSSMQYQANSFQGMGGDALMKEKPTFLFGRENAPNFKHCERPGFQQAF